MTFIDKDNGTPLLFVGGEWRGGTDTWEAGLRPHLRTLYSVLISNAKVLLPLSAAVVCLLIQ